MDRLEANLFDCLLCMSSKLHFSMATQAYVSTHMHTNKHNYDSREACNAHVGGGWPCTLCGREEEREIEVQRERSGERERKRERERALRTGTLFKLLHCPFSCEPLPEKKQI